MLVYRPTARSNALHFHLSDCAMLPCTAATGICGAGMCRAGQKIQADAVATIVATNATASGFHVLRTIASAKYAPMQHSTNVTPYVPPYAAIARNGVSACVYPS